MQPVQSENFWDLKFSNLQWIKVTWNILCSFISQEEFQLILQPSNFLLSEVFQFIGYVVSFTQKLQIIHKEKKKKEETKTWKKTIGSWYCSGKCDTCRTESFTE